MIDSRIALSGRPSNTANSLFQGLQAADSLKQNRLNQDLTKERVSAAQGQNQDAEQHRNMFSLARGAIDTLGFLERGDVAGLSQHYASRQAEIEARGGDASDTVAAMQLLQSGDIDTLKGKAQQIIQGSQQLGIIKGDADGESLSKTFQQGVDESGKPIFFRGGSKGGVHRLDGISPVDPAAEKVAIQTALDTQTPSGQAKLAESKAKSELQQAKLKETIEGAESAKVQAEQSLDLLERMLSHKGRSFATGGTSIIPKLPGSESRDYALLLEQAKSGQFLQAIQQMRGLGQLSNAEGQAATSAQTSLNLAQSDEAHEGELRRLMDILRRGIGTEPGTHTTSADGDLSGLSDEELLNF